MARDAFPPTLQTWINERLDAGPSGRLDVNAHVMTTYALPLQIYLQGSSWRRFGEVDDILNGFFASRLDKPEFFQQWRDSGKRLRYWLINALRFHLQELYRRSRRDEAQPLPEFDAPEVDHRAVDRAWARALVATACKEAQARCNDEGLSEHWSVFRRHHLDAQPYRTIAEDMGITPGRCAVMVRTATARFKAAVADRLVADGAPSDDLDGEIDTLLEAMQ
ncbi:MAG: hypothetical protein MK101_06605 [Phycisphaerales bacterium]|nr:hypothetical protein [Phycisphaerales bacterium]